jgi:hypothetical protein
MQNQEKISITTKDLSSGNCQVKFFVEDERKPKYGYLLITEPKPIGDIIDEIKLRLKRRTDFAMNLNPFSSENSERDDHNFYLYSA